MSRLAKQSSSIGLTTFACKLVLKPQAQTGSTFHHSNFTFHTVSLRSSIYTHSTSPSPSCGLDFSSLSRHSVSRLTHNHYYFLFSMYHISPLEFFHTSLQLALQQFLQLPLGYSPFSHSCSPISFFLTTLAFLPRSDSSLELCSSATVKPSNTVSLVQSSHPSRFPKRRAYSRINADASSPLHFETTMGQHSL